MAKQLSTGAEGRRQAGHSSPSFLSWREYLRDRGSVCRTHLDWLHCEGRQSAPRASNPWNIALTCSAVNSFREITTVGFLGMSSNGLTSSAAGFLRCLNISRSDCKYLLNVILETPEQKTDCIKAKAVSWSTLATRVFFGLSSAFCSMRHGFGVDSSGDSRHRREQQRKHSRFFSLCPLHVFACGLCPPFALPFWGPKSVFWGIFRGFRLKNASFVRIRPEHLVHDVLHPHG